MIRTRTFLPVAVGLALAVPAAAQTLVARYQLNETSGTVCADSSGNGQDGTYRGVTLGSAGVGGQCGTAGTFDDVALNDVLIPGGPQLQGLTSKLSVATWVRVDGDPTAAIFRRAFANDSGGWGAGIWGDRMLFTTRGVMDYYSPPLGLQSQTWYHMVWVFDSSYAVTFYLDGVPVGNVTGTAPSAAPNPDWFIGGLNGSTEFWDGDIDDVQIYDGGLTAPQVAALAMSPCSSLGGSDVSSARFCSALPNSTGSTGVIGAFGSDAVGDNNVTLTAGGLPPGQFGIFVTSQGAGAGVMVGGGVLCLTGNIGRYNQPGQIFQANPSGNAQFQIDLTATPTPTSLVSIVAGETWFFQAWHRDGTPQGPSSNFTDGIEILFTQ